MTVQDIRDARVRSEAGVPAIPRPRPAADDAPTRPEPDRPSGRTPAHFPWPEPWCSSRGTRPRSEYWDVENARWCSRGPAPRPRSGS
jgi:hypothetical protein